MKKTVIMFVPDFLDVYGAHVLKEPSLNGATASELANKTEEMEQYKEMYKGPFVVILMTYAQGVAPGSRHPSALGKLGQHAA